MTTGSATAGSATAGSAEKVRARLRGKSAPLLLCEHAAATPDRIAFRSKHLGLYRERSWRDYAAMVAACASGFAALGLQPGDRVAIMGEACEEWAVCDQAAQALGAIVYGIYPTASATELRYQMQDGGAVLFVAEDQEYVDRLLAVADDLPQLRRIVVIDDAAMFAYDDPRILRYREIVDRAAPGDIDWLRRRAEALNPAAPAFIVYTSGTTGPPKGAVVAHGRHLAAVHNLVCHYPALAEKAHRTVVFLPLCHVLGRDIAVTLPLLSGLVPHYGEDPSDLPATFFEVAPTILFTVPRYLQKIASQVLVGIHDSGPVKRAAYDLAMRLARPAVQRRWAGQAAPLADAAYHLARLAVFRPILRQLGFDRLELAISGGAALPRETMALWQIYGVNVVEMYGQTETAGGIVAGQRGPFPRPGSVGTVPEGWELRLAETGELLVRSPDLFAGYWGRSDTDIFSTDGWLPTGDVGEWTEGNLRLVDRVRDFIVTAGGKTLSPSHVENALRASPYLSEVAVFGHGRKYLTALVEIDFDTVADWARRNGIAYTGFTSLAGQARVRDLVAAEIAAANDTLARVEQVKAFRILPKALDPEEEGDPVTPTRKVQRGRMYERFKALVDGMYDDAEERRQKEAVGAALAV